MPPTPRGKKTPEKTPETERAERTDKDTERVVLVRVAVELKGLPIPGIRHPDGNVYAWAPVLNEKADRTAVRIFRGTKQACIDEYAGKGADARPGVYKAPNVSSWRGQRSITVPDKPKPEALWEDD